MSSDLLRGNFHEDIAVYLLHLKSNLIVHGDREAETAKNIRKREVAITQLLAHIQDVIGTTMPTIKDIVIGGDFNTNRDHVTISRMEADGIVLKANREYRKFISLNYRKRFRSGSITIPRVSRHNHHSRT